MSTNITTSEYKQKLIEIFRNSFGEDSSPLRKQAIAFFDAYGIPTLKYENWKYTGLTFLNKHNFNISSEAQFNSEILEELAITALCNISPDKIIIFNGKILDNYTTISETGFQIKLLSELSEIEKSQIENTYFAKSIKLDDNPFVALNTAFHKKLSCYQSCSKFCNRTPLHLIYINNSDINATFNNPRILVIIEQGAEAKIIESVHTFGNASSLKNSVTEIFIEPNARLEHYRVQDDSDKSHTIDFLQINQSRDSFYHNVNVNIGSQFTRHNIHTLLDGENIETNLSGVFITTGNELFDIHSFVDHAHPNCLSNENYKGILYDNSTGVFNGKILVRKDAQKTNAYQSNKNTLLSDNASIFTKPELEIYADDVKCSHGATSGALDQNSIFYLVSRGISRPKAEAMILNAIADEIIDEIKYEPLRQYLTDRVEAKLHN